MLLIASVTISDKEGIVVKRAFTLAEILIAIGIIGVVSAMTIPTLISKYQERIAINRLKQTYSILSEAFKFAIEDNGSVDSWCDVPESDTLDSCSYKLYKKISPYLKFGQSCNGWGSGGKCFATKYANIHDQTYYTFNIDYYSVVLHNGVALSFTARTRGMNSNYWCKTNKDLTIYNGKGGAPLDLGWLNMFNHCGFIFVDINGKSNPNVDGKDFFQFKIYTDGIAPTGRVVRGSSLDTPFENNCLGQNFKDIGTCTAWVLAKGNMDYLHCPNILGWNKASHCD
jgi:prepilin-type N-terminal cleavage/methylation domain-containing protein